MDRRATEGAALIYLGGREIEYRFARRRRRTLGITVDAGGLSVAAPLRAPWHDVESFLRHKERWILRKLDEWARAPQPRALRGVSGESLPLFGVPVTLEVAQGRGAVTHEAARLRLRASPGRVLATLVRWLKDTAHAALSPRATHYATLLGRQAPRVTISNARTQWGVCTEDGVIRLSWRLVHLEPRLADYVVAHEVAHLVELNHSARFWQLVAALYPDWHEARHRLELAGAGLPILREAGK
ncbi:MAG: M48 family metallopeptidase [Betaproteobacteria bacterium]